MGPCSFHTFTLPPVPAERDVSRTDRTNKFYEGPENPGLGLLNDILLTYCMYHFDLGVWQSREGLGAGGTAGLGWALTPCPPRLRPGHE